MCLRAKRREVLFVKMESVKKLNIKPSQFEIIVKYMTMHPDLCKGYLKTAEARQKANHLWANLSKELNAEGPPQRDGAGWKKVWADLKVHTKAKLRKNKIHLSGTGGGPPKVHPLTSLEEKVSELLNFKEAINGMKGSISFGVQNTLTLCDTHHQIAEENIITDDVVGSDSETIKIYEAVIADVETVSMGTNVVSSGKENIPRMTPKKKQTSLLEKQVENQITYQNSMCAAMKEINENLKELLEYRRRDYELKEKKYELKKEFLELKKRKVEFEKQSEKKKKSKYD